MENSAVLRQGVGAMLAEALRLHRNGEVAAAKSIYEELLRQEGEQPDALHLAGMAHYQCGELEEAEARIRRALRLRPSASIYHNNLGLVLEARGLGFEAESEYLSAIQLDADNADALLNLGNLLLVGRRASTAQRVLQRLLALEPASSAGYNSMGCAFEAMGKLEEARSCLERAIEYDQENAQALANLGGVLLQLKLRREAQRSYQQALWLEPAMLAALNGMGLVLLESGRVAEAEQMHRKALEQNPEDAATLAYLGCVLQFDGRWVEASACYGKALAADPATAKMLGERARLLLAEGRREEARQLLLRLEESGVRCGEGGNLLGVMLDSEGRLDEAEQMFARAVEMNPDLAEAHNNLGLTCWKQGRIEEAAAHYRNALQVRAGYEEAVWNLALAQLMLGDLQEGWRNYEVRWRRKRAPRNFAAPLWQGEPLEGRRILLHYEQGLGDTLQFLRFVPLVQAAGGLVMLDVPERMVALVAQMPGLLAVSMEGQDVCDFDLHCPLMSLPWVLGVGLSDLPTAIGYVEPSMDARAQAAQLPWPEGRLRVGLVWSGSPMNAQNERRSIPLDLLKTLLAVEGVQFYSLQMGEAVRQLEAQESGMVDCIPWMQDLDNTAALVEHLDLVISVDTCVAHLAGAMACPVWTLLPFVPDWRWMLERIDSPWYPTMQLYRQQCAGDWSTVVEQLRQDLEVAVDRQRHATLGCG